MSIARLVGLSLLATMLFAGCAAEEKADTAEPATPSHPEFFVANRWQDLDRSGGADYWEFEGANKWTFRADEQITFASRIKAPIGSKISWQIHAPGGAVIEEGDTQQQWESTWRRAYAGPVVDLLDQGNPGVWWCEWFVNGRQVGECAANLMP